MRDVWAGIVDAVPESAMLLGAVIERIASHDQTVWASMSLPESSHRRDSYLIRYGLPLAEIYGWPERNDPVLADALAAHFFWALSWRHLDNVLDASVVDQIEVGNLAVALSRASRLQCEVACRIGVAWSDDAAELLRVLCITAQNERRAPIPRESIWHRAAPFLIVPQTLLRLGAEREALYQAYINLDGLAHDIHDLLTDVRLGIRSLPASWFADLDPQLGFRRDIADAWFDKAAREVAAAAVDVERWMSGGHFPMLRFFLREADEFKQSLGPHSLPQYAQCRP